MGVTKMNIDTLKIIIFVFHVISLFCICNKPVKCLRQFMYMYHPLGVTVRVLEWKMRSAGAGKVKIGRFDKGIMVSLARTVIGARGFRGYSSKIDLPVTRRVSSVIIVPCEAKQLRTRKLAAKLTN